MTALTSKLPRWLEPEDRAVLSLEKRLADQKQRWFVIERDLERRRKRKKGKRPSIATLRVCELNRLYYSRYRGDLLPDDDDGRDSIQIMINHLAMLANPRLRIADWLRRCAPWFSESEAEPLIEAALRKPIRWMADTLAARLNLTDAERSRLKIRSVGAVDFTKEQRAQRRREKSRLASEAKRRAVGAKPQSQSSSRTEPWKAQGVSRRTWYRRLARRRGTTSTAVYGADVAQHRQQYVACSFTSDEPVPLPLAAAPEEARQSLVAPAVQQPLLGYPASTSSTSPSRAATPFDWRRHSAESWAQIWQLRAEICRTHPTGGSKKLRTTP
jgi:hypothetical protein